MEIYEYHNDHFIFSGFLLAYSYIMKQVWSCRCPVSFMDANNLELLILCFCLEIFVVFTSGLGLRHVSLFDLSKVNQWLVRCTYINQNFIATVLGSKYSMGQKTNSRKFTPNPQAGEKQTNKSNLYSEPRKTGKGFNQNQKQFWINTKKTMHGNTLPWDK